MGIVITLLILGACFGWGGWWAKGLSAANQRNLRRMAVLFLVGAVLLFGFRFLIDDNLLEP